MDTNIPPESPPAAPVIPVGLATKIGTVVAVVSAVCAALAPLLEGDQTPEVIALIIAGAAAAIRVIDGRMKQATAIYASSAPAAQQAAQPHAPELATGPGSDHFKPQGLTEEQLAEEDDDTEHMALGEPNEPYEVEIRPENEERELTLCDPGHEPQHPDPRELRGV